MMNMIEIHQQALKETPAAHHVFLTKYSSIKKCIYGFVEGNDDLSFYTLKLESELHGDWDVELLTIVKHNDASNKKTVLNTYSAFDWERFDKRQVLFFIDRDFDHYLQPGDISELNIYVSDGYSIENSMVTPHLCKNILQPILGFKNVQDDEVSMVLDRFNSELKKFYDTMKIVSTHIIAWFCNGDGPCLNNLELKYLFKFEEGYLISISQPKNHNDVCAYMCSEFKLDIEGTNKFLKQMQDILDQEHDPKRYTRGKYELWFFVEFCNDVHCNPQFYFSTVKDKPKSHINLNHTNAMSILGPRARIPDSLKKFLEVTAVAFAREKSLCAGKNGNC